MRFSDALIGYWLEKEKTVRPNTIRDYSLTFQRFQEFIDNRPVHQITSDDVRAFLRHLRDDLGLGRKTIANAWTALSSFWTWASRELDVEHIIRGRVARPEYRRREIIPYTREEIAAMLAACEWSRPWTTTTGRDTRARRDTARRDRAIILVLLDSGLRASELCNLLVRDYDQATGRLTVREGKGGQERSVYLGTSSRRALWRYLSSRQDTGPHNPLFATRSGRHLDRNNLRRLIQNIARRAGVHGATVHRFRHTFGVSYLRNGGNVFTLQRMLGHTKLDTVRLYLHLAQTDLENAQRKASPADNWRL